MPYYRTVKDLTETIRYVKAELGDRDETTTRNLTYAIAAVTGKYGKDHVAEVIRGMKLVKLIMDKPWGNGEVFYILREALDEEPNYPKPTTKELRQAEAKPQNEPQNPNPSQE